MMGALTDFVQNTYAGKQPGSYGVDYKASTITSKGQRGHRWW